MLSQALDPRRPFVRVGAGARAPGAARARRSSAPSYGLTNRTLGAVTPARPGADGLREGDPLGARRGRTSSRASSKRSTTTTSAQELRRQTTMATTERDYYELLGVPADRRRGARSRRRSAGSRASCTPTSPRRPTPRSASARSSRPTRCSRSPRRASSTTATATTGLRSGGFTPTSFDFGSLADLFSAFFGDDLFGVAAGRAARRGADIARRGRDRARGGGDAASTREVPFPVAVPCETLPGRAAPSRAPSRCRAPTCGGARPAAAGLADRRSASSSARRPARRCSGAGRGGRASVSRAATAPGATVEERTLEVEVPAGHPRRPADPHLRRGPRGRRSAGAPATSTCTSRPARPALRARGQRHLLDRRPDDDRGRARRDGRRCRRSTASSSSSSSRARSRARCACCAARGMPVLQGFGRGDHRVLVNVAMPRRLTDEQRSLLEEFERAVERRARTRPDEGFFEQAEERASADDARSAASRVACRRARRGGARADARALPGRLRGARARRRRSSWPRTPTRAARSGSGPRSARCAPRTSPAGWEERWRDFHRPVRVGPLWVGPPWEEPPPDGVEAVVIDPGRAFGTGAHATTRLCLELLPGSSAASLLDVGCGSGVLAIAAAQARLRARSSRSTTTRPRSRRRARNAARERRRARASGSPTRSREPLPAADVAVANIALDARRALAAAPAMPARLVTSGYLERGRARRRRGFRRRAARPRTGWAADLFRARASRVPRRGDASRSASSAARSRTPTRRRSASGCSPTGTRSATDGADVAVVNTCCVTHEAVSQVAQGRRARGAHARARLRDRLRREPRRATRFAGLPENVVVVGAPSEETPAFVAGDVGAIGCVQADARLDRVRAFVKVQDGCSFSCAFCVIPLVRGASRSRRGRGRARARSAAASSRATARSSSPGSTSAATATARPATTCRGSCARRARRRGSRACASPRSRSTTSTTSSSPRCARRRRSRRHLHVPLQSGDDGVLRAMGRRYDAATYLRRLEPLAGLQPHDRRDRRLPGRGRARVRSARSRVVAAAGHHEGARLPVLAAAGHATRRPTTPSRAAVKKRARARVCARCRARRACARWRAKIGREDVVLVDRPGRGYGDDYSPWLVDAPVGELVRVRGRSRHGGGDPRCLTTASSARSSARATTSHAADGFVAIRDISPKADDAPARPPRAARRRRFREIAEFPAGGGEADARVRRRDGARRGPRRLPCGRERRRRRRPDGLPPPLARARRARLGGMAG